MTLNLMTGNSPGISILCGMVEDVNRFYAQVLGLELPDGPTVLDGERFDFKLEHLNEELTEFQNADNLEQQTDALIDLIYVAMGGLLEMGVAPGPAFTEVHNTNMRRRQGANASRGNVSGDAVKPEGWKPPDLEKLLTFTRKEMLTAIARRNEPRRKSRILVLGHARHGKDTVGEWMRDEFGLSFQSSSMFCAEHVILPTLWAKYSGDVKACYDDRGNHREHWFKAISDFNHPDPTRLGRAIFAEHDVYVGLRSAREFHALKNAGVFDVAIWVDRSQHLPPEGALSISVEPWMADYVLDNNGTLDDLACNLDAIMDTIDV